MHLLTYVEDESAVIHNLAYRPWPGGAGVPAGSAAIATVFERMADFPEGLFVVVSVSFFVTGLCRVLV